jgi:hypothetical protein
MAATSDIPPHMQCCMAGVSNTAEIYRFGFLQIPLLRVPKSVSNAVGHRMLCFPQPFQRGREVFRKTQVFVYFPIRLWELSTLHCPLVYALSAQSRCHSEKNIKTQTTDGGSTSFHPEYCAPLNLVWWCCLWGPDCGRPCHR